MTDLAIAWGRKPRRPLSPTQLRARAEQGDGALLLRPGQSPALRLNSDFGLRYPPDRLAELADNAAKLTRVKSDIERDVDLFARNSRRFLDLYFRFIQAQVSAQASAIAAKLAWSGGLFTPDDTVFSALQPLPNAVYAGANGPTGQCDFAFWTGRALLALSLSAHADASRHDAVVALALAPSELTDEQHVFTSARFPREVLVFWEDDPVPSSPFRPAGLKQGLQCA